jgi:hypothetical protein
MEDLNEALLSLRAASQRLNEATDNANSLVRSVEDFLARDCSVGLYATVKVSSAGDEEGKYSSHVHLTYARISGRYRICIEKESDFPNDPEKSSLRAWAECSRDDKLDTVSALPRLLMKISEAAVRRAEAAEDEVAQAQSVLTRAINKKGGR